MSKLVIIEIGGEEKFGVPRVWSSELRSYNTEIHGGNTEFHREMAIDSKEEVRSLKNRIY
jgi:hypothetical protein